MGKPLTTSYAFTNGAGYLIFSENSTQSHAVEDSIAKALGELADHQLLEGRELSALDKAEFIKNKTGIEYKQTF